MDVHRHADGEHPLPMFVSHLNRDLTSIAFRQAVTTDPGRSVDGLVFGRVEVLEQNAFIITGEAVPPSKTSK
jgi:hypothetical protein